MDRHARRLNRLLAILLLPTALASCSEDSTTIAPPAQTTAVAVDPDSIAARIALPVATV